MVFIHRRTVDEVLSAGEAFRVGGAFGGAGLRREAGAEAAGTANSKNAAKKRALTENTFSV
jgi:hypothetical protein